MRGESCKRVRDADRGGRRLPGRDASGSVPVDLGTVQVLLGSGAHPARETVGVSEPARIVRASAHVSPVVSSVRLGVVALSADCLQTEAALAIGVAERLAHATASAAALVTVERETVKIGRPRWGRRRGGPVFDGFDPIAARGRVTVLDAGDAHAAAVTSSGKAPLVCLLRPDGALAESLAKVHPTALLLVAGAGTSESYLDLVRADLGAGRPPAYVIAARYSGGEPAFDEVLALRRDSAAAVRLRWGLTMSPVTRENAAVVVRAVMNSMPGSFGVIA